MTPPSLNYDLRPGLREPVFLMLSRRQVEEHDITSVLDNLRLLTAAREDVIRYRGQMVLSVDGYNEDPRELLDIAEVRALLMALYERWNYFGFFLNPIDASIRILASAACGKAYPGRGQVEVDLGKLKEFMLRGTSGIVTLCKQHNLPEQDLDAALSGFADYFRDLAE